MTDELRIASRETFRQALAETQADVEDRWREEPRNPAWPVVTNMLERMSEQTDRRREPSLEERRANMLGPYVDRELEPPADEPSAALNQRLKALFLYFAVWPAEGVDPEEMSDEDLLERI